MKPVSFKSNFNAIFEEWMQDAVKDIKKEAIRLVSGPLLHVDSGTLVNSFETGVYDNGHLGMVWNNTPYAYLLEEQGIQYIKGAGKKRQVVKIIKRGVGSNRSEMTTKFRSLNYNKTKNFKPVHFLWTATRNEMTGNKGANRLGTLGIEVGYAIARRYVNMLQRKYEGGLVETWEIS